MATRLRAQAFPGERAGAVPDPDGAADALVEMLQPGYAGRGQIVRHGQSVE
jgi:hypothetical protein